MPSAGSNELYPRSGDWANCISPYLFAESIAQGRGRWRPSGFTTLDTTRRPAANREAIAEPCSGVVSRAKPAPPAKPRNSYSDHTPTLQRFDHAANHLWHSRTRRAPGVLDTTRRTAAYRAATHELCSRRRVEDGSLDLVRFGGVTLKRVRPVLSFKILANMPICFVSIFENIRGENAVYTPREGQGAVAIAAGVRAIRERRTLCALVGACDVKTHEFSFVSLQQLGVFNSWRRQGRGPIPSEGAAFLVLEDADRAVARGARIYARVRDCRFGVIGRNRSLHHTLSGLLSDLPCNSAPAIVAAGGGDAVIPEAEEHACCDAGLGIGAAVRLL